MLYDFATDISKNDVASALKRFNGQVNLGKNFDNIVKGLLQVFREILMFKINSDNFTVSKLKKQLLKKCADNFDISSLIRYINILTDCLASFKTFSSQRVLCECALVKLASPEVNTDFESLLSRLSALENKISCLEKNSVQKAPDEKISALNDDIPLQTEAPVTGSDVPPAPEDNNEAAPSKVSGDANRIIANWNDVMAKITSKGQLRIFTALFGIKPVFYDDKLVLNVSDEDKKKFLSQKENLNFIAECIKETTGSSVQIAIHHGNDFTSVSGVDIFKSIENII